MSPCGPPSIGTTNDVSDRQRVTTRSKAIQWTEYDKPKLDADGWHYVIRDTQTKAEQRIGGFASEAEAEAAWWERCMADALK